MMKGCYRGVGLNELLGSAVVNNSIGFDLNEPFGIDERRDLHDRVHGPNVLEVFASNFGHRLQIFNTSQQHARPDHIA